MIGAADDEQADPGSIAEQLGHLHVLVRPGDDPTFSAVVLAAQKAAEQWGVHRCRADDSRRRLESESALSRNAQSRLASLLVLVKELVAEHAAFEPPIVSIPSASEPTTAPGRRRTSWWRGWPGSTKRARVESPEPHVAGDAAPAGSLATSSPEPVSTVAVEASESHIEVEQTVQNGVAGRSGLRPPQDADIAIHLLGPFQFILGGQRVDVRSNAKGARVLRYLAARSDKPVPRDVLIDVFWPDVRASTAAHSLHQAMYILRRTLRSYRPDLECIDFNKDAYGINPDLSIWCDVEVFEALAGAAHRAGSGEKARVAYALAEGIYEGDYLEDTPYEEWALRERDRLRLLYVGMANRLGDMLLESHDLEAAAAVSRRVLQREPVDEQSHGRLIRCFGLAGQRNLLIRQYRAYVDSSERSYGLGPCAAITELYESFIST